MSTTLYIIDQTSILPKGTCQTLYRLVLLDSDCSIEDYYLVKNVRRYIKISGESYEKLLTDIPKENTISFTSHNNIIIPDERNGYYLGDITDLIPICTKYLPPKIIKDVTKKGHDINIRILREIGIDVSSINDKTLIDIRDLNKKDSTKKNYITALIYHHIDNIDYVTMLRKELDLYNKQIKQLINKNIKTDTQKKNFISWNRVIEITNRLRDIGLTKYHIILSLYTLMYPRRILDYSRMHYLENISAQSNDIILYLDNTKTQIVSSPQSCKGDINKNYFGKYDSMYVFVFNNYKTVNKYGTQILEVDHELSTILVKYIADNNIQSGKNILELTDNQLCLSLNKIFNIYENKDISASMLRHIYLSDNYNTLNIDEKRIIGIKMGHSIEMQAEYVKIDKDYVNESSELDTSREKGLFLKKGCRKSEEEKKESRRLRNLKFRNKNIQ